MSPQQQQPHYKRKPKKEFIDFKTLSESQLRDLSQEWNQAAFVFECRLAAYMNRQQAEPNEEKVERLWRTGSALWRRLAILERWRVKNKKV